MMQSSTIGPVDPRAKCSLRKRRHSDAFHADTQRVQTAHLENERDAKTRRHDLDQVRRHVDILEHQVAAAAQSIADLRALVNQLVAQRKQQGAGDQDQVSRRSIQTREARAVS